MVKKCCVYACESNYDSIRMNPDVPKISVFRFPKNIEERERWIKSIPRNGLLVTDETVVCSLHWSSDSEMMKKNGKWRPVNPPHIFSDDIPPSQLPAKLPPSNQGKQKGIKCIKKHETRRII